MALAPNVPLAAVAMFLFGGVIGGMDVAMNANGVVVEKKLSRAIMSSLHGFWSLGGFAGGGSAALPYSASAISRTPLLVTASRGGRRGAGAAGISSRRTAGSAGEAKIGLPRHGTVYLVGLMALFSMVPEGAVLDWAALYLQQELGADLATAGFAFAGFSGAMAVMRFLGDGVRNRFGAVATLRASGLVAAAGMWSAAWRLRLGWQSQPSPVAASASPTWCRSPSRPPATRKACRRAPA